MSDDLVERVARAICETENGPCKCMPDECGCTYWKAHARAAIAVCMEEAADAVGEVGDHAEVGAYINAIRALKG